MNERIRLLAEQAGLITLQDYRENWDRENWHEYINDVEKFAELIVAECIKVCDDTRKLTWTVPLKDDEQITACVCMIKQHFGVEL